MDDDGGYESITPRDKLLAVAFYVGVTCLLIPWVIAGWFVWHLWAHSWC